ncbi:MAG: hypothetical protein QM751_08570 [Paludibacteraceae bacterium]
MRTLFEAYLTEKDDKYLLYLDQFHLKELLISLGLENILDIRIIYHQVGCSKRMIDEIVYDGTVEVPDISDIIGIPFNKDCFEKIIINKNIEISFYWWQDIFILADLEIVTKYIDGQKTLATKAQYEILERLPNSKNTYFKLKNETLIASQQMNLQEFNLMLPTLILEKKAELESYFEDLEDKWDFEAEPIKLNLTKEERVRLKSDLDIFTFMEAETADTAETVICPCRVVKRKDVTDYKNESIERNENFTGYPSIIEFGSKYYMEAHLLNNDFTKLNKNELIKIKEFYDKFKFPETPEGSDDENAFFDDLSELYLSPTEEEAQELISKYHKYYLTIT